MAQGFFKGATLHVLQSLASMHNMKREILRHTPADAPQNAMKIKIMASWVTQSKKFRKSRSQGIDSKGDRMLLFRQYSVKNANV